MSKKIPKKLREDHGFAPMTREFLQTVKPHHRPLKSYQQEEFFLKEEKRDEHKKKLFQTMMVPEYSMLVWKAEQQKKKEMRKLYEKEIRRWMEQFKKQIRDIVLKTNPMTGRNLAETYLRLAREIGTRDFLINIMRETLPEEEKKLVVRTKLSIQELFDLHKIPIPRNVFMHRLQQEIYILMVNLWGEYVLINILISISSLLLKDPIQMRNLLIQSPEKIWEFYKTTIGRMPWSMLEWSRQISIYIQVICPSEGICNLQYEIENIILQYLENYKDALMLMMSEEREKHMVSRKKRDYLSSSYLEEFTEMEEMSGKGRKKKGVE